MLASFVWSCTSSPLEPVGYFQGTPCRRGGPMGASYHTSWTRTAAVDTYATAVVVVTYQYATRTAVVRTWYLMIFILKLVWEHVHFRRIHVVYPVFAIFLSFLSVFCDYLAQFIFIFFWEFWSIDFFDFFAFFFRFRIFSCFCRFLTFSPSIVLFL